MQKSQRGLMRSAKQQKRKQRLFALCNNNNPINCRRLPSLPLLEPLTLRLAYCRWFRWAACLKQRQPRGWLQASQGCPSPSLGKRAPVKTHKLPRSITYGRNGCVERNLGNVRLAFKTGSEGRGNSSKTEIMHVRGRSAFFVLQL